jgi:hypothetical protein
MGMRAGGWDKPFLYGNLDTFSRGPRGSGLSLFGSVLSQTPDAIKVRFRNNGLILITFSSVPPLLAHGHMALRAQRFGAVLTIFVRQSSLTPDYNTGQETSRYHYEPKWLLRHGGSFVKSNLMCSAPIGSADWSVKI